MIFIVPFNISGIINNNIVLFVKNINFNFNFNINIRFTIFLLLF